jgi:hypothetical protein
MGHGTPAAVAERQVDQALGAVLLLDLGQPQPVDRGPEGVPDGHAEQRPAHPAAVVLLLGTAPDGSDSRTHQDLPVTDRSYDSSPL